MAAQYPAEPQPAIEIRSYIFIIKSELGIKICINAAFSFCRFIMAFFFKPKSYWNMNTLFMRLWMIHICLLELHQNYIFGLCLIWRIHLQNSILILAYRWSWIVCQYWQTKLIDCWLLYFRLVLNFDTENIKI